jgi:hypothetical protein
MALEQQQIVALLSKIHFFHGLNAEKLAIAASFLEEVHYDQEKYVFEQTEDAPFFFFVQSGRLQMTRFSKVSQTEEMLGFLDEGDYFGQELIYGSDRQVSVQAITNVVLLRLDGQRFRELLGQLPELNNRLRILTDSFQLMLRTKLSWVHPEEYVYLIAQRHPIFLWGRIAPTFLFIVLLVGFLFGAYAIMSLMIFLILAISFGVFGLALFGWQYLDWSNDYFIVTSRRIVYQERVILLYDSRQESPIDHIRATELEASQLGRILGYGTLRVRTLTGIINFQGISDPGEVDAIIQEQVKRSQSSLRQAELKAMEDSIARRIGYIKQPPPPPPSEEDRQKVQISGLQRFLSDLFHLRYEMGDTIQYRRHWWVLLTRIWFQSAVLLGVIGLAIWMPINYFRGILGQNFPLLGAFLALCLAGLIFGLWWLYLYVDWHNDIYLVTNDQVVDIYRKPLGTEERQAAQIRNILSVEYKRIGIVGLIFNYGTVYIRVGDVTMQFQDVLNPSEVQRELFHKMAMRTQRERQQQADEERTRMAEWIAAYHRLTHRQP